MSRVVVSSHTMSHYQHFRNDYFSIGYYSQKSPGKSGPNEDSLGFYCQGQDAVLAVADGLGGLPCGEKASKLIIEQLIKFADVTTLQQQNSTRDYILDGIDRANDSIMNQWKGAQTTLTACSIHNNQLRTYQIGDTGLMVCGQKGLLKYQTVAQSVVGYGCESGLINEKEALQHPQSHLICNSLGDHKMSIMIGPSVSLAPYDTVLLASDGLLDNVLKSKLINMIRKDSLTDVLSKLVHLSQKLAIDADQYEGGGCDDVSFILCRRKLS